MHHVAIGDASLKCSEFYDIITFKGGDFVKENKLAELSMEFSVDIINLVRQLKENYAKCTSLRVMLIASCRTAKENTK